MFKKILVLASTALLFACGDSGKPSPTGPAFVPGVATPEARVNLVGYVEIDGPKGAVAYLRTPDRLIPLYGHDLDLIRNLPGAEITTNGAWEAAEELFFDVRGIEITRNGAWEAARGFLVQEFRVLTVRGRQVMDGIVVAMEDGLALRLSTGTLVALSDTPEALGAHIGARVWLAPRSDTASAEFGIIAQ